MNVPREDLMGLVNQNSETIEKYKKFLLVKECKCCGAEFQPINRSDEIYCELCRLTGYKKTMSEEMKEYRKRYKTQHARMVRGAITREEFERWKHGR
jgi:hypothetical protein